MFPCCFDNPLGFSFAIQMDLKVFGRKGTFPQEKDVLHSTGNCTCAGCTNYASVILAWEC